MKIESVTIRGFRCFDADGDTIDLDNLTCFLGPNASGKTAAMMALARLFSDVKSQRDVVPADFHLDIGEQLSSKESRSLLIECRLAFPELEDGATPGDAVPETFNQMIVDDPGGTPYCRIRLEATWTNDGTLTGDIEQRVSWILADSEEEQIDDSMRRKMQSSDRSKIRVVYIPAARDPDQQIRSTTATAFGRLLKALEWAGVDETIKNKLGELQSQLGGLSGVQTINAAVQNTWQGFYDGRIAKEVAFQALEEDPAALIDLLVPTFRPGDDGRALVAGELSDGLRSLFSLSLSLGLFRVEEVLRGAAAASGFKSDIVDQLPVLTIFAVEEPENHLSPHYLGKIVSELNTVGEESAAQVLISSHSPCIAGRVDPDRVRYFLGHEKTASTRVKPIPLPEDENDESFKYVREAVRGYPELYFSRLVILGEGPSEEIVLRRLFEASGTPLDINFISVAPLGGRHVSHFWRLLHGLQIPFLTLLDLDREKEGGGWGRVQYVRDELVNRYGAGHKKLRFDEDGKTHNLGEPEYDNLRNGDAKDTEGLKSWLQFFAKYFGVFFSAPLDLDLAMLQSFPAVYMALAPPKKGPRLPSDGTKLKAAVRDRMRQVLAADASTAEADLGATYSDAQQQLFPWYKYLFVDGSKPVAHMRALLKLDDEALMKDAPKVLQRLIARARDILAPPGQP